MPSRSGCDHFFNNFWASNFHHRLILATINSQRSIFQHIWWPFIGVDAHQRDHGRHATDIRCHRILNGRAGLPAGVWGDTVLGCLPLNGTWSGALDWLPFGLPRGGTLQRSLHKSYSWVLLIVGWPDFLAGDPHHFPTISQPLLWRGCANRVILRPFLTNMCQFEVTPDSIHRICTEYRRSKDVWMLEGRFFE